jgi:hypothetical protein
MPIAERPVTMTISIRNRIVAVMIGVGAAAPMTITQLAISAVTAMSAEAGITISVEGTARAIGKAIKEAAANVGVAVSGGVLLFSNERARTGSKIRQAAITVVESGPFRLTRNFVAEYWHPFRCHGLAN